MVLTILVNKKTRARTVARGITAILAVMLMTAFSLEGIRPAAASTVALSDVHMAASSGSDRPSVTHFISRTRTVYFDYTVDTPSSADTAEIKVFAGNDTGPLEASANLILGIAASFDVKLSPSGGVWADGSYCSELYIDGRLDTLSGMPIGWSVGKTTIPGCEQPPLHLKATGGLHVGKKGSLMISVRGPKHPIKHAQVSLNGQGVGITKKQSGYSDPQGEITFKNLKPAHTGAIEFSASKKGFRSAKTTVRVKS